MRRPSHVDVLDWWLDFSSDRITLDPETGCWLSAAGDDGHGYPIVGVGQGKIRKLGHLVLERFIAPRPEGMVMCHRCDIPECVSPHCLRWDTLQANALDREERHRLDHKAKGLKIRGDRNGSRTHPERLAWGAQNHSTKLTEADVIQIRVLHALGEYNERELAKMFGVWFQHINRIVRNERRKNVEIPVAATADHEAR